MEADLCEHVPEDRRLEVARELVEVLVGDGELDKALHRLDVALRIPPCLINFTASESYR